MNENYSVSQKKSELNPKKETVNFIISYSKSLNILKLNSKNFVQDFQSPLEYTYDYIQKSL